jgi:hypothetical protein
MRLSDHKRLFYVQSTLFTTFIHQRKNYAENFLKLLGFILLNHYFCCALYFQDQIKAKIAEAINAKVDARFPLLGRLSLFKISQMQM